MSCGDCGSTYLGIGNAKHGVEVTDNVGSQVDMSNGQTDAPSIGTYMNTTAHTPGIIRNPTDMLNRCMDGLGITENKHLQTSQRMSV